MYVSLIECHGLKFSKYVFFGKVPIVLQICSRFANLILAVKDLGLFRLAVEHSFPPIARAKPSCNHYDRVRV